MKELTPRQKKITLVLHVHPGISSSDVLSYMEEKTALVTIKRDIAALLKARYLDSYGKGPSRTYALSTAGKLFLPLDAHAYNAQEPDMRSGSRSFDFELFSRIPESLFTEDEIASLEKATADYRRRSEHMSSALHQKELERFVVELSWKSSKIEGNTYTLLDTERLIREGIPAADRSRDETTMILNHKKAFDFALAHKDLYRGDLTHANIEHIHRLLIEDLRIEIGLRRAPVGITGTVYRPLENQFQIREAMESLYAAHARAGDAYTKALLVLAGISYIQPFEDGNKRTARLVANAILIAHRRAPLSYRSVDEVAYREAVVVLYEVQSFQPLKKIFLEQYKFAAAQYAGL